MDYNLEVCEIKYYKESFVLQNRIEYIKYADMLVSGEFTVGYDMFDTFSFKPNKLNQFNWKHLQNINSNTFELYLFGLRHIYILAKAYTIEQKDLYLSLAIDFFISFCKFIKKDNNECNMLNNDHAVSERIENLTYLSYVIIKYNKNRTDIDMLKLFVDDEIKKLHSDTLYQKNHNHGIIADKASLIGLTFYRLENYQLRTSNIIERLKKQVDYALFNDGVHKENSFDYHLSIINLFIGISEVLKLIKNDYYPEFHQILRSMEKYLVYAYKPDLSRPLFGDSKGRILNKNLKLDIPTYNNEYLEYINSNGSKGKKPTSGLKHFVDSGHFFYRSHFEQKDFNKASWLSFKAGFSSRVHKHKDDLSVCWYCKGHDILIDSGMYSYMYGDKIKNHMESVKSHNAPGVLSKTYTIAANNGERAKIVRTENFDKYFYVFAYSKLYDDITIHRHLYYIKTKDILIIRDEFFSKKKHVFKQYFNLSQDIYLDDNKELRLINSNIVLNVLGNDNKINEKIDDSYLSTGFGSYKNKKTLTRSKMMKSGNITTLLSLDDKEKHNNVYLSELGFSLDEDFIEFKSVKNLDFFIPVVTYKNNKLKISKDDNVKKHALYVYEVSNKKIFKKISFTSDEIVYFNENKKEIILLYYIMDYNDVKDKGLIGEIVLKGGELKFIKNKKTFLPKVKKLIQKKVSANNYMFKVNLDYIYLDNLQYSWWVYYNGSCSVSTRNNNNVFRHQLKNIGEYVIIVSIRDSIFGEIFFEEFKKIVIN